MVWCMALACGTALGQDVLSVPALTTRVMDTSGTLSAADLQSIEQQLTAWEQRSGTQMVVFLLPSTAPEDIFSYANRVANVWKVGRKAEGDGLLIVVAAQDRRMRIEVAKTLEGAIPDLAASQIIDRDMTPAFKRGDYAGGIKLAIDALSRRIEGEQLPTPLDTSWQAQADYKEYLLIAGLLGLILVSEVLRILLGRGLGAAFSGVAAVMLAYLFSASALVALGVGFVTMVWTLMGGLTSKFLHYFIQWGGGSSGSGDFRSGGGGDFGGGGASGKW